MAAPQKNDFARRVKEVRKTLNIKQKDFAARLGISGACLSDIEKGKSKPGHDFFYKISREFHVNLYYLFFAEGDMFINPRRLPNFQGSDFAVDSDDAREFLFYFQRSRILQYFILGHYRTVMQTNREAIEKEAEAYQEKPTS
jgi:transcriptional regulator with XRE-family HTH domain